MVAAFATVFVSSFAMDAFHAWLCVFHESTASLSAFCLFLPFSADCIAARLIPDDALAVAFTNSASKRLTPESAILWSAAQPETPEMISVAGPCVTGAGCGTPPVTSSSATSISPSSRIRS